MPANIEAVRTNADAVTSAELSLSSLLYELSFAAEYGYGSLTKAAEAVEDSRRHADRAVLAAAVGNAVMAAKHEVQAESADADADRMLHRAKGHVGDLEEGLREAAGRADDALGQAASLVAADDSSPAAAIHTKAAAQPDAVRAMAQRAAEAGRQVSGSRDPAGLRAAAEHLVALQHELEEASGRAREIASDAQGYGDAV